MGEVGGGDGAAMRRAVRRLSLGAATEGEWAEAAGEVGRLARSDERTKRALPELGVVPPLVSMLADAGAGAGARLAAARALLELARGTHRNKVHIVKAGLLKKLPRLMDLSGSHDLALLLLSVSSLANTDFPLSTADLLPFLVATLTPTDVPADTRLACLAALRNLSAKLEHVRAVVTSGAVRALLAPSLLERTEAVAEAALGVLADVAAASAAGRREMAEDEEAPRALVEAMARHESAGCQEHATYLVMALAHGGGGGGRALLRRMRPLGAVQALLEVSLLGSPLARSRAAKILQWFKDDGQDRIRAHSGPRMEAAAPPACHGNDGGADGTRACRSAVDRIVKQSLDMNMRSIMRRATASVDMTNAKQLVASSSSKSLPC
ncbi:uncharacterized protein LOC119312489 [Triticum dicoccoides]|uniref:uncharacterized protein LOC119312489 n=1 Tax=Triticum dicoccoides TaxID=85692 RepID=UPI000E7BCFD2|nr:uncharacterized protein LOC119312489 [Triticum dicoccoides]